jgi:hypothetical protein
MKWVEIDSYRQFVSHNIEVFCNFSIETLFNLQRCSYKQDDWESFELTLYSLEHPL